MYQTIYHWASSHFYPVSAGILLFLFLMETAGVHKKRSKAAAILWQWAFFGYLSAVLFLTLGSRVRTDGHEPNLQLHWEIVILAVQGRGPVPWEDLANIILFLPFGILFRELFGKGMASYILSGSSDKCGSRFSPDPFGKGVASCILWGAGLSVCIEALQLLTGRGYCDINDFVCNVLGAAGGYGWGCAAIWAREQVGKFGNPMPDRGVDSDHKREKC